MVIPAQIDPADWVTIWQSELAALAVDRECHEGLAALAQAWAAAGDAAGRPGANAPTGCPGADAPTGRPGAHAPAGAAAAGAASGLGQELDALRRRIAELERAAGA